MAGEDQAHRDIPRVLGVFFTAEVVRNNRRHYNRKLLILPRLILGFLARSRWVRAENYGLAGIFKRLFCYYVYGRNKRHTDL